MSITVSVLKYCIVLRDHLPWESIYSYGWKRDFQTRLHCSSRSGLFRFTFTGPTSAKVEGVQSQLTESYVTVWLLSPLNCVLQLPPANCQARLRTSMKICYNFNFILFFSPSLFSIHIYPSTALSNYSFRGGQTFMVEKAPSWSIWSYGADLERPRWDSMLTLSSPLLPSTVSHWTIHSKVPTERPQLGQCQNFIWKSLSHISNLFPETKLG